MHKLNVLLLDDKGPAASVRGGPPDKVPSIKMDMPRACVLPEREADDNNTQEVGGREEAIILCQLYIVETGPTRRARHCAQQRRPAAGGPLLSLLLSATDRQLGGGVC